MPTRRPSETTESSRREQARRRLALIAADLAGPDPSARQVTTIDPGGADPEPGPGPWWAEHTRVVPKPGPAEPPDAQDPLPEAGVVLREPGRHAARRPTPPLAERLPHALPGLGRAHLLVVAALVALCVLLTGWAIARDRASGGDETIAAGPLPAAASVAPLADVRGSSSAASPAPAPSPSPSDGTVTVDVAGDVQRPGIAVLPAGSRVTDALAAAGGAKPGTDLIGLNLARPLVDGEQVVVGDHRGAGPPPAAAGRSGAPAGAPDADGVLVDLNTAGQAELESLPGVGPVTASAIVAWREEHGSFTRVEELLEVDGIGEKTLARLISHLRV